MAKYQMTIKTRPIFVSKDDFVPAELYDINMHCQFDDDAEQLNDFDISIFSDTVRGKSVVAYDDSEEFITDLKGTAIAGTRTSATVFTRTSGTWTVDALIGYWVYSYVADEPDAGSWSRITDNDATTITVDSTINNLHADCDSIAAVPRFNLRNNIRLIPPAWLLGTYFQVQIEKNVPATGNFKYRNIKLNVIPRPEMGQEFIAGMGDETKGWE